MIITATAKRRPRRRRRSGAFAAHWWRVCPPPSILVPALAPQTISSKKDLQLPQKESSSIHVQQSTSTKIIKFYFILSNPGPRPQSLVPMQHHALIVLNFDAKGSWAAATVFFRPAWVFVLRRLSNHYSKLEGQKRGGSFRYVFASLDNLDNGTRFGRGEKGQRTFNTSKRRMSWFKR